jgi:outer membrane receptor protein involved in Fe transport
MRSVWVPACLVALASAAGAEEASPEMTPRETSEETVVVTASRSEQARFEVGRSVEVLGAEGVRATQARSTPEAAGELPGVYLQQTNRGAGTPFLRGLVGPQNLILVDGVRFQTAIARTGPNQVLALVDPYALERLEVLRGPSSVLYGHGAMGGVIQALTRPAGGGRPLEADLRLSSADSGLGLSLQSRGGRGPVAWFAGLSLDDFGPLRAGGGVEQPWSDYTSAAWQAKLELALGSAWSLGVVYLGARIEDAGRMDRAGNGDLRFYDNADHLGYLALGWRGAGALERFRLLLSYHRTREDTTRETCATAADGTAADLAACLARDERQLTRRRFYQDAVDVLGVDASLAAAWWSGRLRLSAGAEAYLEQVASGLASASPQAGWAWRPEARGNYSDGSRYDSLGAYLHLEGTPLDLGARLGQLRLNAGVRLSRFSAAASDVPGLGGVEFAHTGWVGAAGIQWLVPGRLNLYLSFVQGFRAPNLQETTNLGDTGQKFSVPNAALGPERGDTLEVGGRFQWGPLEGSLAFFHSFLSDAVTWQAASWQGQEEIEGKPVIRLVNATHGVHQGVESSLAVRLWRLTLRGALTWTRGEESPPDGPDQPARWIPPLFGQVGLRYDHPGGVFWAEALVRAAGRQERLHPEALRDTRLCETAPYSGQLREPCDGLPGYASLHLRAGFSPVDRLAFHLTLDNLTDRRYRTFGSGLDMPGLDARLTLSVMLERAGE